MRLPRVLKVSALVLTGATLASCGVIRDRSDDYLKAESGEDFRAPQWLNGEAVRPLYPVPDLRREALLPTEFVLPEPPDLTAEILQENYAIESVEGQAWVLVNDVPGRVWPAVEAFLQRRGLPVAFENPRVGLLQTVPVTQGGLTDLPAGQATVVLARISPGVRRKSSEVQFRLVPVDTRQAGLRAWPDQGMTVEERRFLEDLAKFLRENEDSKSYSRLALEIPMESRIQLVNPEGELPYLTMALSAERAWVEVTKALAAAEIPVVDVDRSAARWYVDFREESAREGGWFTWLRGKPKPEGAFVVMLEKDPESERLRLRTLRAEGYTGEDRSRRLLSVVFEHLY